MDSCNQVVVILLYLPYDFAKAGVAGVGEGKERNGKKEGRKKEIMMKNLSLQ